MSMVHTLGKARQRKEEGQELGARNSSQVRGLAQGDAQMLCEPVRRVGPALGPFSWPIISTLVTSTNAVLLLGKVAKGAKTGVDCSSDLERPKACHMPPGFASMAVAHSTCRRSSSRRRKELAIQTFQRERGYLCTERSAPRPDSCAIALPRERGV